MAGYEAAPKWLNVAELAAFFGPDRAGREEFKAHVEEKLTSEERLFDRVQRRIYLGTERWIASMRERVESKPRSDAHPRAQRAVGRPSMTTIVGAVADELRIARSRLLDGRGGAKRMLVAWLGWREGLHSLRVIADTLGLRSLGRVSNLVHEAETLLRSDTSLAASDAALRARFA